jgi:NADH-quinone oxidoreductase subunit B
MLMDAILKIHAKIMDEPLGHRRAAELAASGHKTELVPSSIKFAPKKKLAGK